jgi:hypothetical protein
MLSENKNIPKDELSPDLAKSIALANQNCIYDSQLTVKPSNRSVSVLDRLWGDGGRRLCEIWLLCKDDKNKLLCKDELVYMGRIVERIR